MTCPACGSNEDPHMCNGSYAITNKAVKVDYYHPEHHYDIKVSNDNTKGEKRVTVHVRSDDSPEAAQKLADKLYKDTLGS